MKKIKYLICAAAAVALCACSQNNDPVVKSPDGRIEVRVETVDGQLTYSVLQDGEQLLLPSRMGFELTGGNVLGDRTEILSVKHGKHRGTWESVWGEKRVMEDNHNSMTVSTANLGVEVKVFNDGLGFRYIFPEQLGEIRIGEELTEYRFARNDHKIWWMADSVLYYEAYANRTGMDEVTSAYTPVTIEGADGRFYSIHEAALLDFAKVHLTGDGPACLKTSLSKMSDGTAVYVNDTRHSPWRTIMITDRAGALIESNLMLNLNEPCKIEDTSWIRPGKYVGIWWELHKFLRTWYYGPEHGATTQRTKEYIDFAAANGIEAVLVEGWNLGWEGDWGKHPENFDFLQAYPDYDFDEVMKYAASKGVQMIIHNETGADLNRYFEQIDEAFALYQSYGMHYVKTGNASALMDKTEVHDSQYGVNRLHEVVEKAAKYQICIDEHEPVIPTGVCRTWPNLMTGEAIRGQEHDAWEIDGGNKPEHQTVCPFIRGLAGPMDYTFGTFDFSNPKTPGNRVRTTIAKQLAQYVVIYSPLQMASDLYEAYEGVKAFDFIRDVPADWEQTKVIDAVIGDYIVTARQERGGQDWYLGAITDENSREINVSLEFLKEGLWMAQIYADAPDASYEDNPTAYTYSEQAVSPKDVLKLHLATSGGCAIRFVKQ